MRQIDLSDPAQRNGAVYFVVGRGTEGGGSAYRLSVATNKWGSVPDVIANSGYSIGTIQVDLGQRGEWPLGSTTGLALLPEESSYVDSIIDQASAYARANALPFPSGLQQLTSLRSDLLTHGNGLNGRSSLSYISTDTRQSINTWAASEGGQQWIHQNIDFPQIQALADSAKQVLDQHGTQIPDERKFEVLCILAKSANQHPASYNKLVASLRNGADYETFMQAVDERTQKIAYFDGGKAGELARQYQENHQKPGLAAQMNEAHRLVAQPGYQPSTGSQEPSIQTSLKAFTKDLNDPSVLDLGDKGDSVIRLQQALVGAGQKLSDDGNFGPGTEKQLRAYQAAQGLDTSGFGDRNTLQALGLAPMLDQRSTASLNGLVESLHSGGRFSESQIARIAESSQTYMLDHREALGDVTSIRVSKNDQTLLFQNDHAQMRELPVQRAIDGYASTEPLFTAAPPPSLHIEAPAQPAHQR